MPADLVRITLYVKPKVAKHMERLSRAQESAGGLVSRLVLAAWTNRQRRRSSDGNYLTSDQRDAIDDARDRYNQREAS